MDSLSDWGTQNSNLSCQPTHSYWKCAQVLTGFALAADQFRFLLLLLMGKEGNHESLLSYKGLITFWYFVHLFSLHPQPHEEFRKTMVL